ncbi:MAG: phage tail protein [Bacillota bacterium]
MLIVKNLAGNTEPIAQYKIPSINSRTNGNRALTFMVPNVEANSHAYALLEDESTLEYDGISYRVKSVEEKLVGTTPVKYGTAPHVFFDLVDEYRYTTLTNGAKSLNQLLDFIFAGTGWAFSIIDSFPTREFENFGNDNCLALFQKALDRFGAEFELDGTTVTIRQQIGGLIDFQFRYNHNVKTLKKSVDTSNLSTFIRGYGKQNEDGTYVVEAEYTSPMADIYGIKHAPPYSNDSITQYDTLLANMQRALADTPRLSIELEFATLADAGYTASEPKLGDIVPTIYEPLGIDVDLRIVEVEQYPESKKSPRVILANVKRSLVKTSISYQKSLLDRIWDENSGKLRNDVYSEAVQRASEALNNSLTELEYPPGMGIIARDPNDANRFVALRSAGLGVTTDGGINFPDAITPDGVNTSLLTAGQIKTNNIEIVGNDDLFYWDGNYLIAIDANDPNKFTRLNSDGLYSAKGSFTLERPDGYKVVNNGISTHDYNVSFHLPGYCEGGVSTSGFWYTQDTNVHKSFTYFSVKHTARYLKFVVFMRAENASDTVSVKLTDAFDATDRAFASSSTTVLGGEVREMIVDLGVPTGNRRAFYGKFRSTLGSSPVYVRILQAYLEG